MNTYEQVIAHCRDLFEKKNADYGTSWRILRLPSLTDQIYIKAMRVRSVQEKGTQKISDDLASEFVGMINYCAMALMQLQLAADPRIDLPLAEVMPLYNRVINETFQLQQAKNHDYGDAWRQMRVSSITDIILMKLFRLKQIENNDGRTFVSEGVAANYQDILNYSVFCLILMHPSPARKDD
jgi:hypothetical protein